MLRKYTLSPLVLTAVLVAVLGFMAGSGRPLPVYGAVVAPGEAELSDGAGWVPWQPAAVTRNGSAGGGGDGSDEGGGGDNGDNGDDSNGDNGDDDGDNNESGGGSSGPSAIERELADRTDDVIAALNADRHELDTLDDAVRAQINPTVDAAGFIAQAGSSYHTALHQSQHLSTRYDSARDASLERTLQARQDAQGTRDTLRAPAVGDPVRLSDGAYLSTIPMPVISFHGVSLDITPVYDSTRTTENLFGAGWYSTLDSRVIKGATRPPEIEEELADSREARSDLAQNLASIWSEVFNDSSTPSQRAATHTALSEVAGDAVALAAELRQRIAGIETDITRFRSRGLNTHRLDQAVLTMEEYALHADEIAATGTDALMLLERWEDSDGAIRVLREEIDRIEEEFVRAVTLHNATQQRNAYAQRPGQYPFLGETGKESVVLLDLQGNPLLFVRTDEDAPYRTANRADGELHDLGVARGWRWDLPEGTSLTYDSRGYLRALTDRNNNHIVLSREHNSVGSSNVTVRSSSGVGTGAGDSGFEHASIRIAGDSLRMTLAATPPSELLLEEGLLRHAETPRGTMTYEYTDDLLTGMTDGTGATTELEWETHLDAPRVRAVTDPEGGREQFLYPAPDRRIYRDPDGVETEYILRDGLIVQERSATGGETTYEYDERGNLLRRQDSTGYSEQWRYDETGNFTEWNDSMGFRRTVHRDRFGLPLGEQSDRGTVFLVNRDDRGNVIAFREDKRQAYTVTVAPDGTARSLETGQNAIFHVENDRHGRPVRVVRDDGQVRELLRDDWGRVLEERLNGVTVKENRFDEAGRLVFRRVQDQTYTVSYDRRGDPVEEKWNGLPYRTTTYDRRGLPVQRRYYDDTREELTYTPAGRIASHRTRRGALFRYRYDAAGRLVEITEESTGYYRRWEYDELHRVTLQEDTAGAVTIVDYDPAGVVSRLQFAGGEVMQRTRIPGGEVRTTLSGDTPARTQWFDPRGFLLRDERAGGSIRTVEYTPDSKTERIGGELLQRDVLDRYGRLVRREFPDGTAERLRWDIHDNPVERVDRTGEIHRWDWDRYGRPVRYEDPLGRVTRWAWSEAEVLREDPDGTHHRYAYDREGRLSDLDGTNIAFTSPGEITLQHRSGAEETVRRDVLGRITEHDVQEPASPGVGTRWEHGLTGSLVQKNGRFTVEERFRRDDSRRILMDDATYWEIARDLYGFPRRIVSPFRRETSFGWSPGGVPHAFVPPAPGAQEQRFQYDRLGRLTERTVRRDRLSIDRNDRTRSTTLRSADRTLRLAQDPYGRVTGEAMETGTRTVTTRRYRYDAVGRRTLLEDASSGERLKIEYDDVAGSVLLEDGTFALRIDRDDRGIAEARIQAGHGITIPVRVSREAYRTGISVADRLSLIHRRETGDTAGEEVFLLETRSPAGRRRTEDALAYVTDTRGRILGEASLDGTFSLYEYDRFSRLAAVIDAPATPIPGDPIVSVDPGLERRLVAALNRHAPSLRYASGTLLGVAARYRRDPDGRQEPPVLTWDDHGRVTTTVSGNGATTRLGYDPILNHVVTVESNSDGNFHGGTAASTEATVFFTWDHRGKPVEIRYGTDGRKYTVLEETLQIGADRISVRSWRRYSGADRERSAPAGETSGRYRDYDTAPIGREGAVAALEIRLNRRPFLVVDEERLFVYFTDIRGTSRGVAVQNHEGGLVTYHRYPGTFDTGASGAGTSNTGAAPTLPGLEDADGTTPRSPAVATKRTFSGLDRYTAAHLYFSSNRVFLAEAGIFTTPDPLLDGLDVYLYADGDPVNYVDLDGLFIAPVSTTYFQQDSQYGGGSLGLAGRYSIRDAGCVLVAATRIINNVVGHEYADPGVINREFAHRDIYLDNGLLSTERIVRGVEELTGHAARVQSFSPDTVDMNRVSRYLRNDPDREYHVTARISVPYVNEDGEPDSYLHTLNVVGFDAKGEPHFADTSNRNRRELGAGEEVLRYDVYSASACPQFR